MELPYDIWNSIIWLIFHSFMWRTNTTNHGSLFNVNYMPVLEKSNIRKLLFLDFNKKPKLSNVWLYQTKP